MSTSQRPCVRCNQSHSNPRAFLLRCCRCERCWHHTCHIPPVTEQEILKRYDADVNRKVTEGLGAWQCRRCSKKQNTTQDKVIGTTEAQVFDTAGSRSTCRDGRTTHTAAVELPVCESGKSVESIGFHATEPPIDLSVEPPQDPARLTCTGHAHGHSAVQTVQQNSTITDTLESSSAAPSSCSPSVRPQNQVLMKDTSIAVNHVHHSTLPERNYNPSNSHSLSASTSIPFPLTCTPASAASLSTQFSRILQSSSSSDSISSALISRPPSCVASPDRSAAKSPTPGPTERRFSSTVASGGSEIYAEVTPRPPNTSAGAPSKLGFPPIICSRDHRSSATSSRSVHRRHIPAPAETAVEEASRGVSVVEHEFAEMQVETHDIDDLYGPVAPQYANRAAATLRQPPDVSAVQLGGSNARNLVHPSPGLLFSWQGQRYSAERGHRDELDRLLSKWEQRLRISDVEGGTPRTRTKLQARYLNKKERRGKKRRGKERATLTFTIHDWMRNHGAA